MSECNTILCEKPATREFIFGTEPKPVCDEHADVVPEELLLDGADTGGGE